LYFDSKFLRHPVVKTELSAPGKIGIRIACVVRWRLYVRNQDACQESKYPRAAWLKTVKGKQDIIVLKIKCFRSHRVACLKLKVAGTSLLLFKYISSMLKYGVVTYSIPAPHERPLLSFHYTGIGIIVHIKSIIKDISTVPIKPDFHCAELAMATMTRVN
jgi:hypothetical protein